jgi:hypothetical protein
MNGPSASPDVISQYPSCLRKDCSWMCPAAADVKAYVNCPEYPSSHRADQTVVEVVGHGRVSGPHDDLSFCHSPGAGFREAADVARKVLTESAVSNVSDPAKFRQVCVGIRCPPGSGRRLGWHACAMPRQLKVPWSMAPPPHPLVVLVLC